MRLRVRVLVFVSLALSALGIVLVCSRGTEPVYQGRRLNSWLEDIANSDASVRAQAESAFRAMGTNIVPALAAMIGSREDTQASFVVRGYVHLFGGKARPLEAERHWREAKALRAIGAPASAAIPALTALLDNPESRDKAAFALAGLGPKAVEPLTRALTNQDAAVRVTAANALGSFGPDAKGAVAALVRSLADTNRLVRQQAAQSLGEIALQPELMTPALIAALSDSDAGVRMSTALALGSFREKARDAVPSLQKAEQDPDPEVRQAASNALSRIGQDGPRALTR
jgi:HEAT repeat protein